MPLPTFLTHAELAALREQAVVARDLVNKIVADLEAAGELNIMPEFRKASGALYAGIRTIHNHQQARLRRAAK